MRVRLNSAQDFFMQQNTRREWKTIVKWLPAILMIADLMTKPLQGDSFLTLTAKLTGNYE